MDTAGPSENPSRPLLLSVSPHLLTLPQNRVSVLVVKQSASYLSLSPTDSSLFRNRCFCITGNFVDWPQHPLRGVGGEAEGKVTRCIAEDWCRPLYGTKSQPLALLQLFLWWLALIMCWRETKRVVVDIGRPPDSWVTQLSTARYGHRQSKTLPQLTRHRPTDRWTVPLQDLPATTRNVKTSRFQDQIQVRAKTVSLLVFRRKVCN
jgi:hypothetical protein